MLPLQKLATSLCYYLDSLLIPLTISSVFTIRNFSIHWEAFIKFSSMKKCINFSPGNTKKYKFLNNIDSYILNTV
ncbi:unnamed protein product [Rotaria socialis]